MDSARRARAERWCSILAMVAGALFVVMAFGRFGVLAAVVVVAAFVAGVVASRV
jgi:hypothetical protein